VGYKYNVGIRRLISFLSQSRNAGNRPKKSVIIVALFSSESCKARFDPAYLAPFFAALLLIAIPAFWPYGLAIWFLKTIGDPAVVLVDGVERLAGIRAMVSVAGFNLKQVPVFDDLLHRFHV